jgi:hypothetical protein
MENLSWAQKTINDGPSGSGPVARSVFGPAQAFLPGLHVTLTIICPLKMKDF